MSDTLSPRAQSILASIELEGGVGSRAPESARVPPAARGDGADRAGDAEIGRLVEGVAAEAEQARRQLATLSAAIEDIVGRLGVPLEADADDAAE